MVTSTKNIPFQSDRTPPIFTDFMEFIYLFPFLLDFPLLPCSWKNFEKYAKKLQIFSSRLLYE